MRVLEIKIQLDQTLTDLAANLHDMFFNIADDAFEGKIAGQVVDADGASVGEWTIYGSAASGQQVESE